LHGSHTFPSDSAFTFQRIAASIWPTNRAAND
jgi:hypothetical protein